MLIDDALYRWTQIGIIVALPAALMIWAFAKRRFKLGLVGAIGAFIVLAAVASVFTVSLATPALRAETGGRFTKAVVLSAVHYHFINGTESMLKSAGREATVVINDTDQPMAVMPVIYSYGGFAPPDNKPTLTIGPFSAATSVVTVDYYGAAEHAPPHSVQAGVPQTTRYWLTAAPN